MIIQVQGDPNDGDGLVETPLQVFFKCSGILVSVDGTDVSPHEDHSDAKTANGSGFYKISGKPINIFSRADTCGHKRNGSQINWFDIQS